MHRPGSGCPGCDRWRAPSRSAVDEAFALIVLETWIFSERVTLYRTVHAAMLPKGGAA